MWQSVAPIVDPISGGSGWVGAGLLGAVLCWLLMMHLPAKDRQLKDLIEGKDKQLREILDHKEKVIDSISREFRDALQEVTAHCQRESDSSRQAISQILAAMQDLSEKFDRKR